MKEQMDGRRRTEIPRQVRALNANARCRAVKTTAARVTKSDIHFVLKKRWFWIDFGGPRSRSYC